MGRWSGLATAFLLTVPMMAEPTDTNGLAGMARIRAAGGVHVFVVKSTASEAAAQRSEVREVLWKCPR